MRIKTAQWLSYITAVGIGVVPALFLVFNSVFSDVSGAADRWLTFLLVVVAYAILGIAFGFASSAVPWKAAFWLAFPALAILAWYSTREPGQLPLHLLYLLLALISAAGGAYAGLWLRPRFRRGAGATMDNRGGPPRG
jgi:hypothetical protein